MAIGNLVSIWHIFPLFGILCQEKFGNPALKQVSVKNAQRLKAFIFAA
jgi:hypothetical protein